MTYPKIRPALTLDFAKTQQLDPRITFSRSSSATYVDSTGLIKTVPDGVARFEYDSDGKCLGLLVEEARTNLVTTSIPTGSGLGNGWVQRANTAVTTNADVAPDGTTTATSVVPNVGSTDYAYTRWTLSSSTTASCVVSAYAKPLGSYTNCVVQSSNSVSGTIIWKFNFTTGLPELVADSAGATTAFMEPAGNGWFRVGYTSPVGTSNITVNGREGWGGGQPAGDGVSGALFWGCQIEEGKVSTSYVPTAGSTVTRAADVASISNAEMLKVVNPSGNTCLMTTHWSTSGANQERMWDDGAGMMRIGQWRDNQIRSYRDGGNFTVAYTPIPGQENYNTVFESRDGNDIYIGNDAGAYGSNISTQTLPGTGSFLFGYQSNGQSKQTIAQMFYYPQPLTQAELEATSKAMT